MALPALGILLTDLLLPLAMDRSWFTSVTLLPIPFMLPTTRMRGGVGAKTVGLSAPTGQTYTIAAVEVKSDAPAVLAHDAATESHTGTTGWTTTPDPFTFSHPAAAADVRGILVFCFVNANVAAFTSVSYGGVNAPAVTGGEAIDTATEPGRCKAFFLGAGIPQGTQTVSIDHNADANVKYAVCISILSPNDTVLVGTPVLLENDVSKTQQSINSGTNNAIRYAGCFSGLAAPPTVGADSTLLHSIDFGALGNSVVRETTPGSGSRLVGWTAAADDTAAVHLGIMDQVHRARQIVVQFAVTRAASY